MKLRLATRRGVSLIEVAAVATIMGLVALFAISSVRFQSLGNYGAEVDTRDLAAQLQEAKRRAVSTGQNHVLLIRTQKNEIVGYHLQRRDGNRLQPVGEFRPLSRGVSINADSKLAPEFTFEGNAVRSQQFDVRGQEHGWRVSITQAGGGVVVSPH